jgi:uracil DNA glycosylase
MTHGSLRNSFPGVWPELLGALDKDYLRELDSFLDATYREDDVKPPRKDVFRAFRLTSFEAVRVVILGEDPYPKPGHAMAGRGWERLTDKAIELLGQRAEPVPFLGTAAWRKAHLVRSPRHLVRCAFHPSPRVRGRLVGCRHFSQTNWFLEHVGSPKIRWDCPGVEMTL